jgi:threonine dehydrogenase-like Zn-dependent dehydrogenase
VKAITVEPGRAASAGLEDIDEPPVTDGEVLVETLAIGVCGTDAEIVAGDYGWAPPGRQRLVLGHESLGRVLEAPTGAGVTAGDLVVGIVRRPDPVPCANCAIGEWDMCRNGSYTERGIKERDGYGSERFRIDPAYALRLDPVLADVGVLVEPTSVVAKAWDHIERIGHRASWSPTRVLVTGAGPIGLLASLLGVQRGLDVHVYDIVSDGVKPDLVAALGATYHHEGLAGACAGADVVVECTGVGQVVFDVAEQVAPDGIVCLVGVSPAGRRLSVDAGALNTEMVIGNRVVFGSVNANRRHYEAAAEALAQADRAWLERLISRRVPLADWAKALERGRDEVKVVIEFAAAKHP